MGELRPLNRCSHLTCVPRDARGRFLSMDSAVTARGTKLTTTNGSDQVSFRNFTMETQILDLLVIITALVGLAGNSVVLWLLGFRIQRKSFSIYILNLAGADFLFLCFQIIHSLRRLISSSPITVEQNLRFHLHIHSFFTTMFAFTYLASLSILSAISTERCLSVLSPIWYRSHRPRNMSVIICTLIWFLSLLLSTLEGSYCHTQSWENQKEGCKVVDFITAAWLISLFVLLSGCSLALLTRLWCGSRRVPLTRLYVTVGLSVLVFLNCGLPLGILWFLLEWIPNFYMSHYLLYQVAFVLSCVNSCANPIIYFFVGSFRQWRQQQQTLKLVLERALQDTPEVDKSEGGFPLETQGMSGSSKVS
ncbi:mas-related G-protein coupled receptor member X2-like [Erinaceus europaeus]|uniref:Mas-related G-protein coupled receptor member X2-like n=1 Tax=Erinaceus europaeus TaxID=9365 RepID=A0A1S2Z9H4_ERIEU|nr:mas-related G-protein coupled receptor member X2-like [Erinaceus europaeus]